MTSQFELNRRALQHYIDTSPESHRFFKQLGDDIRDEARDGAKAVTTGVTASGDPKVNAIVSQVGSDSDGIYVDVGYARHHPGFFLWWWEVGTVHHAAVPHLRPALRPGRI